MTRIYRVLLVTVLAYVYWRQSGSKLFQLDCVPDFQLFQYHVDFKPDVPNKAMCKAMIQEHTSVNGKIIMKASEEHSVHTVGLNDVKITLKLTNEIDPASAICIQLYNIIFNRLQISPGFVTSIIQLEKSVMLIADMSHKILNGTTEWRVKKELFQKSGFNNQRYRDSCAKKLAGEIVLTSLQSPNVRPDTPGFNPPVLPTGQWLPCYVSAVKSPSEFYCQLSSTTAALDVLMEEIVQHMIYTAPGHDSIQKASLALPVLAKFSADGLWYRARVTGVLKASNKVEVYFVDYGNQDTVASTDLKQIPSKIMSPPEMALSCTLAGLVNEECVVWTQEETDMFSTIVEEKELKLCYMEEKDRAGHFIVHLLDEQENVNRSFLQSTRKLATGYASPVIKCKQFEPNEGASVVSKAPPPVSRQISASSGGSNQSSEDGWPVKSSSDPASGSWKQKTGDDRARETKGSPLFQNALRNVISEQVKEDEQMQSVGVRKGGEYSAVCQKDSGKSYGYIPLHPGQTFSATVSFVFHPGKFFCQNKSNKSSLDNLLEHLNAMYGNLGDGDNGFHMISLAKGQACCAKYSEDDMWYRAKVLTADSSSAATVQFVDYGNEATVPLMKIRLLHEKFFHVPVQSMQCSLYGVEPTHGEWSAGALDLFKKLTAEEELLVKVIEVDTVSNGYKVELLLGTSEGSAQSQLIRAGFAKSLVAPVQERCPERIQQTSRGSSQSYTMRQVLNVGMSADVYVSFVVDPGQFWCQLVQEASQLDGLMESLGNDYDNLSGNDLALARPAIGQPCHACVLFVLSVFWIGHRHNSMWSIAMALFTMTDTAFAQTTNFPYKDRIVPLSSTNFSSVVLKSQEIWVVTFFSPGSSYNELLSVELAILSSKLKGWSPVMRLGSVLCTEPSNKDLCKSYNVPDKPVVKLFPLKSCGTLIGQTFIGILSADNLFVSIKRELLWSANNCKLPSSWPNLQSVENPQKLWEFQEARHVFIVIEDDSMAREGVGIQVILDHCESHPKIVVGRMTSERSERYGAYSVGLYRATAVGVLYVVKKSNTRDVLFSSVLVAANGRTEDATTVLTVGPHTIKRFISTCLKRLASGTVTGAAAALGSVPFILRSLGFLPGGPAAGTFASDLMQAAQQHGGLLVLLLAYLQTAGGQGFGRIANSVVALLGSFFGGSIGLFIAIMVEFFSIDN